MNFGAHEFTRLAGSNLHHQEMGSLAISREAFTNLGASESKPAGSRTVKYKLSSDDVARDGHRLFTAGIDTTAFEKNPVVPWAHDVAALPVGKMIDLNKTSMQLTGVVQFATRDLNPLADAVYEMTRQGFLNAVSVSWLPIKWQFSSDRSRGPGAIDFEKSELLEVSVVPVPALASALAQARSAGVDIDPVRRWAEQILDHDGISPARRDVVERARRAALGHHDADQDRELGRRRRAAEALRLRIEGEDRAARHRRVEAIRLAGESP